MILPPGYLRDIYAAIRAAGGVCVADEVQTGFGRAGSHFWMFETQGVVPDIVTLGKPIGNGHPMGAVITTPEIAASFANGMEYFNTFGGNPVSCAVGLAVLDVIRDEGLQENARVTGDVSHNGLRDCNGAATRSAASAGLGLFLGFDLPDERFATELVNRMKDRGVLLSTDGPRHNVIKIKPPIVFSQADADLLLERLDEVLGSHVAPAHYTGAYDDSARRLPLLFPCCLRATAAAAGAAARRDARLALPGASHRAWARVDATVSDLKGERHRRSDRRRTSRSRPTASRRRSKAACIAPTSRSAWPSSSTT